MKKFDIKRFSTLLQWSMVEERGFILRCTISVTLVMTAVMFVYASGLESLAEIAFRGPSGSMPQTLFQHQMIILSIIVCGIYWIMLMTGFSLSFRCLGKKQQRTSYLMLPASNLEKFLSRFLLVSGGSVLVMIVSFAVADVLHYLLISLAYDHPHFGLFMSCYADWVGVIRAHGIDSVIEWMHTFRVDDFPGAGVLKTYMSGNSHSATLLFAYVVLEFLSDMALFFFLSILFRRFTWLFSWALYALLGMLPMYLTTNNIWLSLFLSAFSVVVLPFCAYQIFIRTQVINNKIVNL